MLWTYPCTVNNECLYQGVIRCPALFNEKDLMVVQRGLASYREFRAKALDPTLNCQPSWDAIAENENQFYVKVYNWRTGQQLAKRHREEGLLLELDVSEVTYPLLQKMCRNQPGVGKQTQEPVALVPANLSLYSTLKAVWHVAEETPERCHALRRRYRNVQLLPLALYKQYEQTTQSTADSLSRSSKQSTKQSRGPRGA